MTHPMKYYEDLKRAWKRAHIAVGAVCKAFDDGDMEAVELNTKLTMEALQDAGEAAGKFAKAAEG